LCLKRRYGEEIEIMMNGRGLFHGEKVYS
jgi:hypothetical protein